jgi:LCP family protein required for cell wall assembly
MAGMQRGSAAVIVLAVLVPAAVIGFLTFSSSGSPAAIPSAAASAGAEPPPSASVAADLVDRRWTVLYVGTDLNASRESRAEAAKADALMLVSLSADQSELTLVSLPRDTVDVPLADGGTWDGKINSLYHEVGTEALVGAMEALYGVPIDAHVVLDMDDFVVFVDAAGGIQVAPSDPIADPIVDLDMDAGRQPVDGATALSYVRTRVDEDYGRMRRQQEVIMAVVTRLVDPASGTDLRGVLDGLDSLETDLPLDELPTLVELARRASEAEVHQLIIKPPLITFEGDRGDGRGYILEADVDGIRAEVQGLIGE